MPFFYAMPAVRRKSHKPRQEKCRAETRVGFHPDKLTRLDPVSPPDTLGPAVLPVPLEERSEDRQKATLPMDCELRTNAAVRIHQTKTGSIRRRALVFPASARLRVRFFSEAP